MSSTIWTERRKVAAMGGAILLLLAVTAPPLIAQSGGTVDLRWHALPSGGTRFSSGGNVMLGGSLGQFGPGRSVGGNAFLVGGFWNPDSGAPLAVTLDSFNAQAEGKAIRLVWETASEIDHLGFNLYRSVDDGQGNPTPTAWARLNADLIPSPSPGSTMGQHYEWLDADVVSGQVYWYQLEAVDVQGGTQVVGSVSAEINSPAAPSKVWLPLVVSP